jgi:hypothetical protein
MKTTSLFLLMTALVAVSCKKSKDPGPKFIEQINSNLQTCKDNSDFNDKATVWFSNDKEAQRSMSEISADKKLQALVFFGHYKDKEGSGLYAPTVYPIVFGQEKWTTQNNTIFRKPAFTQKEFQELMEDDSFSVTDEFIDKSFKESTVIGNKVTKIEIGDVFMFESMNGKYKGMVKVNKYYDNIQALSLLVWVK